MIPARGLRSAPIRNPFTIDVDGTAVRYEAIEADTMAPAIYWQGLAGHEPATLDVFMSHARRARTIIDVGANTGLFTLVACAVNPTAEVIAVEPIAALAGAVRCNAALNGYDHRVTVIEAGAYRTSGCRTFLTKNDDLDVSHIRSDREIGNLDTYGWIEVDLPTAVLDDVAAGLDVDLVKIDIEGGEADALEGMTSVLERCRPAIVLEVLPWTQDPPQAVLDRFGYRYQQITLAGLVDVDDLHAAASQHEDGRNFLCTAAL